MGDHNLDSQFGANMPSRPPSWDMAKLTGKQWGEIRERYAEGESAISLAAEFKVSTTAIWSRVEPRGERRHWTRNEKAKIRDLYAQGWTCKQIGEKYNATAAQIGSIVRGVKRR